MENASTTADLLCSFCSKEVTPGHPCADKLFGLLNVLATTQNQRTGFQDIENLVFQGGGVKGVAYLGVLEELKDVLPGIKRIAGASAGSMLALYLGLNLSYEEIYELIFTKNFLGLLDDDILLKVCTNAGSWNPLASYKYKDFSVRDIIFATFSTMKSIVEDSLSTDQNVVQDAQKKMTQFINNVLVYFKMLGDWLFSFLKFLLDRSSVKSQLAKTLISLLTPRKVIKSNEPALRAALVERSDLSEPSADTGDSLYAAYNSDEQAAHVNCNDQATVDHLQCFLNDAFKDAFELQKGSDSEKAQNIANDIDKNGLQYALNNIKEEESHVNTNAVPTVTRKSSQSGGANRPVDSQLKDEILHYAVAELLRYFFYSSSDATGQAREQVGLFTGSRVKEELIINPIKDRLTALGLKVPEKEADITFDFLQRCTVDNKPCFRNFYITSFNTRTLRSEVFSAEHTPNVTVTDAVRASMSIPFFFTAVPIRENGLERQIYYDNDEPSQPISYMDGGVFDNFPMLIFDDLQYCLPTGMDWKATDRVDIKNPHTLGFKLIGKEAKSLYLNPYKDGDTSKMRSLIQTKYTGSFLNILSFLVTSETGQQEESRYINLRSWTRTAYVDDCGISTFAFQMGDDNKIDLMESGKQSVREYLVRSKNKFKGEGFNYK